MPSFRNACGLILLSIVLVDTGLGQEDSNSRPNIVVFLSDDQGWGDFSCNGNSNLSTPNIDSLAKDGVLFENFYVCPVCSPTRAEFLTGRYHTRGNVFGVSRGNERLSLEEKTIADALKKAGYATGCFGKWHNGMQYPYHPCGRGFDEFYGFCSGHWGHYFDTLMEHNGKLVKGKGYINDDVTDHALRFIESHKSKPFFTYIPYNTPHWPPQVPDEFWQRFANKDLEKRYRDPAKEDLVKTRSALAMVENIDWNVGRVLAKLDELKIAENTIVIYFNDNGPNSFRWNAGVKGRKGSTDEGGVRSPLFVRWPNRIKKPGRRIKQICAAIDLMPTLCAATGSSPANDKQPDGVSLLSILDNKTQSLEPRMIFSHWGKRVSVRTDRFRMDNQYALFDMANDIGQTSDISKQFPATAANLKSALLIWKKEHVDTLERAGKAFTLGHPAFNYTQLPARDATSTGDIKRSSRHPNCSYFTGWNSTDDYIEWPVNVVADGKFEVELRYALAKEDVGVHIELSCGDSILTAKIDEAHEPPVKGPADDKFKRAESVVKDFRPISLGTMNLKQGEHQLKFRTTDIPGENSIEFRLLMFERIKKIDTK